MTKKKSKNNGNGGKTQKGQSTPFFNCDTCLRQVMGTSVGLNDRLVEYVNREPRPASLYVFCAKCYELNSAVEEIYFLRKTSNKIKLEMYNLLAQGLNFELVPENTDNYYKSNYSEPCEKPYYGIIFGLNPNFKLSGCTKNFNLSQKDFVENFYNCHCRLEGKEPVDRQTLVKLSDDLQVALKTKNSKQTLRIYNEFDQVRELLIEKLDEFRQRLRCTKKFIISGLSASSTAGDTDLVKGILIKIVGKAALGTTFTIKRRDKSSIMVATDNVKIVDEVVSSKSFTMPDFSIVKFIPELTHRQQEKMEMLQKEAKLRNEESPDSNLVVELINGEPTIVDKS